MNPHLRSKQFNPLLSHIPHKNMPRDILKSKNLTSTIWYTQPYRRHSSRTICVALYRIWL